MIFFNACHSFLNEVALLQSRIDLLTKEKYEAEKSAAVAEARYEQLNRQDESKK